MEAEPLKTRILLVEEDEIQRLMIREYLQIVSQYEVLEVEGIYHLLAHCESALSRISLVLLDMEWSRVDGVDLIMEIRRRNPALPILGMTDRQADLCEDPRLRRSLVGCIPKPFSPHHLFRSIKAVLKAHAAETLRLGLRPGRGMLRIGSGKRLSLQTGKSGNGQYPR